MAMDIQSLQALVPPIVYKPCHPRLDVPTLQSLPPPVPFLPLRWSLITSRPISLALASSTTNSNVMPKSGQTGKRPDYRSVESWKETKNVDHEAQ
jgi:hypothetical protein